MMEKIEIEFCYDPDCGTCDIETVNVNDIELKMSAEDEIAIERILEKYQGLGK